MQDKSMTVMIGVTCIHCSICSLCFPCWYSSAHSFAIWGGISNVAMTRIRSTWMTLGTSMYCFACGVWRAKSSKPEGAKRRRFVVVAICDVSLMKMLRAKLGDDGSNRDKNWKVRASHCKWGDYRHYRSWLPWFAREWRRPSTFHGWEDGRAWCFTQIAYIIIPQTLIHIATRY